MFLNLPTFCCHCHQNICHSHHHRNLLHHHPNCIHCLQHLKHFDTFSSCSWVGFASGSAPLLLGQKVILLNCHLRHYRLYHHYCYHCRQHHHCQHCWIVIIVAINVVKMVDMMVMVMSWSSLSTSSPQSMTFHLQARLGHRQSERIQIFFPNNKFELSWNQSFQSTSSSSQS